MYIIRYVGTRKSYRITRITVTTVTFTRHQYMVLNFFALNLAFVQKNSYLCNNYTNL